MEEAQAVAQNRLSLGEGQGQALRGRGQEGERRGGMGGRMRGKARPDIQWTVPDGLNTRQP